MKRTHASPEEIEKARKLRRGGMTLEAIASELGRSIAAVARWTEGITETRKKVRVTPDEIAEIRRLRSLGRTYEQIVEATGRSMTAVYRYAKDVKVPKRPDQIKASASRYEREQKRRMIDEKQGSVNWPVRDDDDPMADFTPRKMPPDPSDFDTSGLFPDPSLLDWSVRLLRGWEEDRARGVAFERRPPAVSQALLVILHDNRIWLYDQFLQDRENWKTVRQLAGVSVTDLGERVGLGMSSVSRYESNTRQPDVGMLRTLHAAYTALLEEAVSRTELSLAYDSAFEHFAHEQGVTIPEVEIDGDEALRWITGVGMNDEDRDEVFTIDHLTHLAHVRSMLPVPAWRDEETVPFNFVGYPEPDEHDAPPIEESS